MRHLTSISAAFGFLFCVGLVLPAGAIQPQRWTHSTEADFAAGETDGVVVTNLGDLKVATAVETLAELPEGVTVIYDIVEMDGVTLLAAGPEAKLLGVTDGEVTELMAFEGYQLFAMLPIPGTQQVTLALSGSTSKLTQLNIEGQEVSVVREVELPEVRYVWDMTTRNDRRELVLATGIDGKVLSLDEAGEPTELLDTAQANVLCLAAGPDGSVYAGTDTDGLIYRIEADGSTYVVYDADEPEIGALLVTADGTVYAGTADAEQAKPGRLEDASEEETGRPEPDGASASTDEAPPPPIELPVEPEPQPLDTEAGVAAEDPTPPDAADGGEAQEVSPDTSADEEAPADASTAEDEIETVGPPSPEQYDTLREEIRKRLLAARKSGAIAAGKSSGGRSARPTRTAKAASESDRSGNAVYRIDPRGFVSEVFRESVMVLKLAEQPDGQLLVGTGNEGQLYRVDTATGETSVVNDLESQQLLALSLGDDGTIIVGGANPAGLVSLSDETADGGGYTSDILDAGQISLWGTFLVDAEFPQGGRIEIETRSGNVADPEIAAWSDWAEADSKSVPAGTVLDHPLETKIASPPARYLQYRLTLGKGDDGGAAGAPIVSKIELAYVTPNLRPAITSLTAAYPDFPGVDEPASPAMSIGWEATDDNGDRLLFDLDYKPAAAPADQAWLSLAEDVADTSFEWDTRKVPDGRYRLRVTADDRLDNPGDMGMTVGRLADPVLIDNTPPAVELTAKQTSPVEAVSGAAKLSGTAADQYSPIHSVAYSLDGAEEYTPVLPDDLIYDSTYEAWSATLRDLSPGGHAVTVRAIDVRGNATYSSKLFEVK